MINTYLFSVRALTGPVPSRMVSCELVLCTKESGQ